MMTSEDMKRFVTSHFDRLINQRDISVIAENVHSDYVDHDGPSNRRTNLNQSRERTIARLQKFGDLRVEIRDVLADNDRVVVRNVWTAYDPEIQARVEMHGFVLFRLQEGRLAERWATITEAKPLTTASFEW